jgi:hypothetical protein
MDEMVIVGPFEAIQGRFCAGAFVEMKINDNEDGEKLIKRLGKIAVAGNDGLKQYRRS